MILKRKTREEIEFYEKILNDKTGGYDYISWLLYRRTWIPIFQICFSMVYWVLLIQANKVAVVTLFFLNLIVLIYTVDEYLGLKRGTKEDPFKKN